MGDRSMCITFLAIVQLIGWIINGWPVYTGIPWSQDPLGAVKIIIWLQGLLHILNGLC